MVTFATEKTSKTSAIIHGDNKSLMDPNQVSEVFFFFLTFLRRQIRFERQVREIFVIKIFSDSMAQFSYFTLLRGIFELQIGCCLFQNRDFHEE